MDNARMKLTLIQSDISWNAPIENLRRCAELVRESSSQSGELLVFPEMFTCGFSLPTGEIARDASRVGRSLLADSARSYSCYAVGSTPEETETGEVFNTVWLYRPDGSHLWYRKAHLFSFGAETERYSAGSALLRSKVCGIRCTFFICYDLRFTMPFFKTAADTDLFVIVANWPASRREHWLTLLRARAIEYQCYVAGVNRVGSGGGLDYSGDSAVFAPDGSELCHLGNQETVRTIDISAETVALWREQFPALRDRRLGWYESL